MNRWPYWLLPCDHRGDMLGWSRWRMLKHWARDCKDPVLMAWDGRKSWGGAIMAVGGLNVAYALTVLWRY